jgi:hypothetical protein
MFGTAACQADRLDSSLPSVSTKASASAEKRARTPDIAFDCDDLPALSPEELARPPRELRLERAVPSGPHEVPRYTVLPNVSLSDEAASKLAQINDAFSQKTREHIVITSGTRDPAQQAKAMYKMLELGADILRLYKNKSAAREIQRTYDATHDKPKEEAVVALYEVIKGQIARGIYISAHLRAGAVDVRSRSMSPAERHAFVKAVADVGGVMLLEESKPPHYHLQIE